MMRKYLLPVLAAVLSFAACEKQEMVVAPLGAARESSGESKDICDSLERYRHDLFRRIYLSDMQVAKMLAQPVRREEVVPVAASEVVKQK